MLMMLLVILLAATTPEAAGGTDTDLCGIWYYQCYYINIALSCRCSKTIALIISRIPSTSPLPVFIRIPLFL
ncbi:hypothetical protein A2U01_0023755 [Trifolium medium]|uniref:Secreted peptide n=1 Tax=Trifolium medium TaxID=97028 RepID=A0A392NSA7_9FABA|nr:hypothetical protein [Trifolium medium]